MHYSYYSLWDKDVVQLIYNQPIYHIFLGPDTWGSIPGYEVCGDGAIQSPIDLVRDESLGKTDKIDQEITFDKSFFNEDAEGEFFNNGHTGNTI